MRRRLRRGSSARLLLIFFLTAVAVILALRTRPAAEMACNLVRSQLPKVLGLRVEVGRCSLDPIRQRVALKDVVLRPMEGGEPLVTAESFDVSLGAVDPFSATARIGRVRVLHPTIHLDLRNPAARPPEANMAPCPLRILERVGFDRIDIEHGAVALKLPGERAVQVEDIDLRWRSRGTRAELQLQARQGVVDLGPGTGPLALAKLAVGARYSVRDQQLALTGAEIGLDDYTLTVAGSIDRLCKPSLQLDAQMFVPMRALAKATGIDQPVKGHLWARLGVSGEVQNPSIAAEVRGQGVGIGVYQPGDFHARLSLNGKDLVLQELMLPLAGGSARITGKARLEGNIPVQAKLDADRAGFGAAVEKAGLEGSWVDFEGTGRANVSGRLLPSLHVSGDADIVTEDFVLASQGWRMPRRTDREILAFPRAHVLTQVTFLADRVEFRKARVSRQASLAEGEVTIWYNNPAQLLKIEGRMPSLDLGDFQHIAGFRTLGRGSIDYRIGGPASDITVDASLSLRDVLFWDYAMGVAEGKLRYSRGVLEFPGVAGQKGRTAYHGALAIDFAPKSGPHLRLKVRADDARAEDLVDMLAPLDESIEVLQDGTLTGRAQARVDIDSPLKTLAGDIDVTLSDVRLLDRRMGSGSIALRFVDGQRLTLDALRLTGPAGALWAQGDFALVGAALDYRFRMEPVRLSEWVGEERAGRLGIRGDLVLEGKIDGTGASPRVTASLGGPRVTFGQRDMGAMKLTARMENKELTLEGAPFADSELSLRTRLREPYAYEAKLKLSLPELRPLLPSRAVAQGFDGRLSGELEARGQVQGNKLPELIARLDQLELGRDDLLLRNEGPVRLRYENGRLWVDSLRLEGPNTELSARGSLGGPGLGLGVRGVVDLRLLETFVPRLERASGRLELNASLGGALTRPSFVGSARWSNARFGVRDESLSVRDLSGRAEFSDARFLLEDVEAVVNEGRVRIRGEAELHGFRPRAMQILASLDQVAFRPLADLPVMASGELQLTGGGTSLPKLGGELTFSNVRYEQPIVIESFVERLLRESGGRRAEESREWLRLDVGAHLADARIDNNLARARMTGTLRLVGTNKKPAIVGTVEAVSGGQAFFRGNQFTVTQGLLEFRDPDEQSALFDLRAETQVREYRVLLHAFGRTSEPKVLFTSEPPLPEGDIVSLLTLGITSRDRSNTAGTGAGLAAEALLAASGLDRQVQRFLPKNALLRDISIRIATLYNSATGMVEATPQLESKLLTEQLKIRIAQPVSGRGTRAQAEYQFTDRLSAQAQWDNENLDYSYGNLGLDLKLRWEAE